MGLCRAPQEDLPALSPVVDADPKPGRSLSQVFRFGPASSSWLPPSRPTVSEDFLLSQSLVSSCTTRREAVRPFSGWFPEQAPLGGGKLTPPNGRPRGRPRSSTKPDQVVHLRLEERRDYAEIAGILAISENTARAYYSRRSRELRSSCPSQPLPHRPNIEGAIR